MSRALCSKVSSEGSLRSCDRFTVFYGLYGPKPTPLKSKTFGDKYICILYAAFVPHSFFLKLLYYFLSVNPEALHEQKKFKESSPVFEPQPLLW